MPLDIQTFSIVIGGPRCDAHCPFCISKQTGICKGGRKDRDPINWHNLAKAWRLAQNGDTTTVLMTGEGEPVLYPLEITAYLKWFNQLYRKNLANPQLCNYGETLSPMPIFELQTNALRIGDIANLEGGLGEPMPKWLDEELAACRAGQSRDGDFREPLGRYTKLDRHLREWHQLGLDTMAISAVDIDNRPGGPNSVVYREPYPDLTKTVAYLRGIGYSVRLCIMMMKGGIDSPARLAEAIEWCKANDVTQFTARPIRRPKETRSDKASRFVEEHGLEEQQELELDQWIRENGNHFLTLHHGARLYDFNGQNVGWSDCITDNSDSIRTLIFYSNGDLICDWKYKGAKLLAGWPTRKG